MKDLHYSTVPASSYAREVDFSAPKNASNNETLLSRNSRRDGCDSSQFKCENGECIESLQLCDGSADCKDRSDETEEICKDKK